MAAAAISLAGTITQLERLSSHLHQPNLQPAVNLMQMCDALTPFLFLRNIFVLKWELCYQLLSPAISIQ